MKTAKFVFEVGCRVPQILSYRLFRAFDLPRMLPMNLTISVTNKCNSHCKTCFIWKLYQDRSDLREKEFKAWEFEKVFESLGKSVFWATLSGGEPFLRSDLPEICIALYEYCKPEVINIPTNALLPKIIENMVKKILEECNCPTLIVNLSLDGIGIKHDKIRGVLGNFMLLMETYERLKRLKTEFSRLQIGIHSVISKYSINGLLEVYELARQLGVDHYITEVAEQRTELFTVGKDISPDPDQYVEFVCELSRRVRNDLAHNGKLMSRIIQAFRLVYYQITAQELRGSKQIIPCYAGFASCQITPYGDIWPCCVLGYDKPLGNLRNGKYDFKKIWFSKQADEVRKFIKNTRCVCPLANAHYTNMLFGLKWMAKVLLNALS